MTTPAAASATTFEPPFPSRLIPVYAVECLSTFGTALLQLGFFFYATDRWGWEPRHNLMLAAAQGTVYVFGALGASLITRRLGRKLTSALLPLVFAAIAIVCGLTKDEPRIVAPLLVAYFFFVAAYWPVVESLAAAGADPHGMSKRLSVYNLLWPGVAAVATALSGSLIQWSSASLFYLSAALNVVSGLVMLFGGPQPEEGIEPGNGRTGETATRADIELANDVAVHAPVASSPGRPVAHSTPSAEPELLHHRTLALWLSRIALPSTYIVIYALAAVMPTLPALSAQSTSVKSVVGSVWLAGRWLAFCLLAFSTFWHTRPRLLVVASAAMLLMFLGICVPVSRFTGAPLGSAADLITLSACQLGLGLVLALIYSASLYFGMVLSEGSTEHGGYHEALIGLGQVLGPGAACVAQFLYPGSILPTVAAVSAMLVASLGASSYAMLKLRDPE